MRSTLFLTLTLFFALTCLTLPSSFAQSGDPDYTARLIYFLPRGNTPHPNIDKRFDEVLKGSQKFFADEMERHGYGRKTFKFETDKHGNAVVNHVTGRFTDAHYILDSPGAIEEAVWEEIGTRFGRFQNIHLVVIDAVGEMPLCGAGGDSGPASGNLIMHINCFNVEITAHELGHAFGLEHDFRNDTYLMSYGYPIELSPCHAEWLDVHSYFNMPPPHFNDNTEIEMAPPVVSPPHAIRLRFAITDPDGLHQAQLMAPATAEYEAPGSPKVLSCKSLSGQSETVEFVTTELMEGPVNQVVLKVMDVHGNFTRHEFPIDVTHLLPRDKVVSIPDANLATFVKETLELAPRAPITQRDMLKLTFLAAPDPERQITDLTGLEHAIHLKFLHLGDNQIRDLTPLAGLTQLKYLSVWGNQITDITPLLELSRLVRLILTDNPIHDHAPIARLTRLQSLELNENQIHDVSFLSKLTQLQELWLSKNQISDITPLTGLTKLNFLALDGNPIQNTAPLQTIRQNNPDMRLEVDIEVILAAAGPKIEGPWLWIIVPALQRVGIDPEAPGEDWLATASGGSVTEAQIAANGATAGERVQDRVWTLGKLAPAAADNVGKLVNTIGLATGSVDYHVAYGSVVLESPREQKTWMYAGSDDNHKVWLNGELVRERLDWHWNHDYQEFFLLR